MGEQTLRGKLSGVRCNGASNHSDVEREINDFYGHEVGDEILKEIASRMQQVKANSNITIYRLQADEFVLLMKRDSMETNKNRSFYYERNNSLYNEIRSIIGAFVFLVINDKVFICNESEINISATVGAAKVCDGTGHKALYNADMALKKAKQMRKHYLLFDETMEIAKEYENNIKWTFILKEAVANDQIVPFYQPIINNKTGKIEKYECLCRLVNSNNDIISPYYFLDIAKKIRLYPNITRRILIKSFEKFADLPYEFSINVSVFDIQNEETRHCIKSILLSNQDVAKRAVFELLESDGIENYDIIKAFIEEVKSFGCKVAIDDFGSGYSNFDHVMSLDVDVLKIDASMIKNLDKEISSQIITRTIVNFTKELNIKTVSEFVHTPEVFKKVQEFGIDYSQGYLFGEPAPDVCKNDKVSLIF
jgi:diguanylate cyclase (GGDEF)-like protein